MLTKFQGAGGVIPEDGLYQARNSTATAIKTGTVLTFDFQNESTLSGGIDPESDDYIFEHLMLSPASAANGGSLDSTIFGGSLPTVVVTGNDNSGGQVLPDPGAVIAVGDRPFYSLHGCVQAYVDYSGGTLAIETHVGALDNSAALHPESALATRQKLLGRLLEATPNGVSGDDVEVDNTDSDVSAAGQGVFHRAAGSWTDDGFEEGDVVFVSGYAATAQNRAWIVKSATATDLVVYDPRDVIILEIAGAGQFVRKLTTKVWVEFNGVEGVGYKA